jgi:hypothetical protein
VSAIRRVLLVGDTHSGSVFSPLPEPFALSEGAGTYQPGPYMRWMNNRWAEMVEWSGEPHHLVLMGDLIEGVHHRTTQIICNEPSDHARAAVQLLAPLCERVRAWGGKVYVLVGTECHVGSSERSIARELGAERNPLTGSYAFEELRLKVCGTWCHFTHHGPTSARPWTRGTPMSSVGAYTRLHSLEAGYAVPKVVATGHAHTGRVYHDASGLAVSTFAWQGLTRHGHKVVPSAATVVGAHMLDWTDRQDGEVPEVQVFQRAMNLAQEVEIG